MIRFFSRTTRDFFAVWTALPKQGHLPRRADFEMPGYEAFWPYTSILEWQSTNRLIFQYVGKNSVMRRSFDPVGRNYFDLLPAGDRAISMSSIEKMMTTPCGVTTLRFESYDKEPQRLIEHCAFPAIDDDGLVRLLIGVTIPIEDTDKGPESESLEDGLLAPLVQFIDIGAGLATPEPVLPGSSLFRRI
jgi:hypothetical protein